MCSAHPSLHDIAQCRPLGETAHVGLRCSHEKNGRGGAAGVVEAVEAGGLRGGA